MVAIEIRHHEFKDFRPNAALSTPRGGVPRQRQIEGFPVYYPRKFCINYAIISAEDRLWLL
jgi:hypothetical protein